MDFDCSIFIIVNDSDDDSIFDIIIDDGHNDSDDDSIFDIIVDDGHDDSDDVSIFHIIVDDSHNDELFFLLLMIVMMAVKYWLLNLIYLNYNNWLLSLCIYLFSIWNFINPLKSNLLIEWISFLLTVGYTCTAILLRDPS